MHPLGIRRSLYEKHPWLALNIYLAFAEAKRISQAEMFETAALKIGYPWIVSAAQEAQEVLGPDIFPYGVESSKPTLDAAIRYSMEQFMAVRTVTIEELFPPNTLTVPKT
jgi:4,5-dihydroxyphthalate decarboxylase